MAQNRFITKVIKQHSSLPARVLQISTPHGEFLTPTFMPVATRAYLNFMTPAELVETQSQIILGGNTYHMLCTPGMEILQEAGGMHPFMGWQGPMLTDSGGFQVFSLSKNSKICKINHDGARFKHPLTGEILELTPKTSIGAQKIIGADIIMAFDECTPEQGGREAAIAAMERTHRWLYESIAAHEEHLCSAYGHRQALFGIIQGGSFLDLRAESTEFIVNAPLDGIAIGGEVIGFDMQKTIEVIDFVRPMLPDNKARYTMGVGSKPQDLIDVVANGIDMFDCVAPTRNARHGTLYCGELVRTADWIAFQPLEDNGKILIKKGKYAKDNGPIMPGCTCYTCRHFSRAYLHYLHKQQSMAYCNLACIHNVTVMQTVCEMMRDVIMEH